MAKVTRRQRDCLAAIDEITRGQGYPPTLSDIACHMNVAHRSTVRSHVENLRKMGLVAKADGKRRTTALTDKGREVLMERRLM